MLELRLVLHGKGSEIKYRRGYRKIGQNLAAQCCDPPIKGTQNFLVGGVTVFAVPPPPVVNVTSLNVAVSCGYDT